MVKEILEWVKTIGMSIIIALVITMFIRPTLVKGYSMFPTLEPNNYLIINKIPYMIHEPERGDIVVFRSTLETSEGKKKDLIKRIVAISGDTIKIKDSVVYINDEKIEEPYINGGYTNGDLKELTIKKGKVFVMGDNRSKSKDSRDKSVGQVDVESIRGKVLVRLFPFNRVGSVQ